MLIQGTPEYVFGSFNDKTGPTQGFVVSVQSNGSTTGTILFQITSGNVPVSGALITVVGTTNAGGNFNVTNATITNVYDRANVFYFNRATYQTINQLPILPSVGITLMF